MTSRIRRIAQLGLHSIAVRTPRLVFGTALLISSVLVVVPVSGAAAAGNNSLQLGHLSLNSTFNSIGVEMTFSGDDNANAIGHLFFKKSTDSTWRNGLPMWRVDDGSTMPGRAFYGSALLLEPGTTYNVKVAVNDADGVIGGTTLISTIGTRAEDIASAQSLTPTSFVDAVLGNDTSVGSSSAPWKTLNQAMTAAPNGAVVQVRPGYYVAPVSRRTLPMTLIAQYPAVDDATNPINPGLHSVIESGLVSGPIAAPDADVVKAPWRLTTFVDPNDSSKSYPVWKWAATGWTGITQLGYATDRGSLPKRLANWKQDTLSLATPAGWAKLLYTNLTYRYGFYQDNQDLYLRLPGDVDPNSRYLTGGSGTGLYVDGPSVRVSGLELRNLGHAVEFSSASTRGIVDHALLSGNSAGVAFYAGKGIPSTYGSDHVVQYDRIVDSSLWSAAPLSGQDIPWVFIKTQLTNADGSLYPTTKVGGASESVGVWGRGGARRVVVRHNTVEGTHDGVVSGYNIGYDRYSAADMDINDNVIRDVQDDALEAAYQVINLRAWNNRIEDSSVVLSTDPATYGPIYFFRNQAWRIGNHGVARDIQGNLGGPGSLFFKFDADSNPPARVYVLQNTLWTDPSLTTSKVSGGAQYGSGTGASDELFYLRNNIIQVTTDAFQVMSTAMWNEDYNYLSTSAAARGLNYLATPFTTDVAGYRVASKQGAHTNVSGNFVTPPAINNSLTGDLGLPYGSPLVDAGTRLANLSDRPGVDFNGTAPDLGAIER